MGSVDNRKNHPWLAKLIDLHRKYTGEDSAVKSMETSEPWKYWYIPAPKYKKKRR